MHLSKLKTYCIMYAENCNKLPSNKIVFEMPFFAKCFAALLNTLKEDEIVMQGNDMLKLPSANFAQQPRTAIIIFCL